MILTFLETAILAIISTSKPLDTRGDQAGMKTALRFVPATQLRRIGGNPRVRREQGLPPRLFATLSNGVPRTSWRRAIPAVGIASLPGATFFGR